jgi:hypothetical protein
MGLILACVLIAVERSMSLYQLGFRTPDGEGALYINSFEIHGVRDRF